MAEQVNIVVAVTLFAIYCNLINSADQTAVKHSSRKHANNLTHTYIHVSKVPLTLARKMLTKSIVVPAN